jgi:hypothetical protein
MDRAQLLRKIENAWQALRDSYAGLANTALVKPGVTGDWSVKDIIAHVSCWEEEALEHLPIIMAGGKPPKYSNEYGGIDAFNAQMTEQRKDLSLHEVLQHRDETHKRLIAFVQGVPEEHFASETRFRRRLRLDTYGHYSLHEQAIREWRQREAPE